MVVACQQSLVGCGVLEFGEGEVGAYGRSFEDVEGVKVDLLM